MDKNESQATTVTPTQTLLFDAGERTYKDFADRDESHFTFLNRSAWKSVESARTTLGNWFSVLPEGKKEDIRSRFRSDDRQHQGALLELATHHLLHSICTGVQVDPSFNNLTPDFAATYEGTDFVVECTVAQESDEDINATRRVARVKKAIDSVDTGRFLWSLELLSIGPKQPPTGELCRAIKNWMDSLDPDEERLRFEQGYGPRFLPWCQDGWEILFEALAVDSGTADGKDHRAIGVEISDGGWRQDDARLKKVAYKKSRKIQTVRVAFPRCIQHSN